MMYMEVTVIIPFLNEGIEVRHTLASLKESTSTPFELILINDGSDDGYDYAGLALEYGARYIEHRARQGVAPSRDEGARICQTEYMLLLDAHMRIYQDDWIERFVSVAKRYPESILCGATLDLDEHGELKGNGSVGYGAYINYTELKVEWVNNNNLGEPEDEVLEIPCVLGASYFCRRAYWERLQGLVGLRSYGLDEQLLSLKVRLSGGRCLCLREVQFGHIFRTLETVPYRFSSPDFLYNILLVAELLFSSEMKVDLLRSQRLISGPEMVNQAVSKLQDTAQQLEAMKTAYRELFTRPIGDLVQADQMFFHSALRHS